MLDTWKATEDDISVLGDLEDQGILREALQSGGIFCLGDPASTQVIAFIKMEDGIPTVMLDPEAKYLESLTSA